MSAPIAKLKSERWILKKAGAAASLGTIGEILGFIIAQYIPDTFLPDNLVAHGVAALLALVGTFFFSSKYQTNLGKKLRDCFADADLMFVEGHIDEKQHLRMRESCFERFLKSA
jgi:hypothetical protein